MRLASCWEQRPLSKRCQQRGVVLPTAHARQLTSQLQLGSRSQEQLQLLLLPNVLHQKLQPWA